MFPAKEHFPSRQPERTSTMHRQAKVFLFSGPGANPKSVADVEQILSDDSQQRFNVVTMDHMPTNFLTSSFDAVVFPGGSGAQQYSSLGAEGQVRSLRTEQRTIAFD